MPKVNALLPAILIVLCGILIFMNFDYRDRIRILTQECVTPEPKKKLYVLAEYIRQSNPTIGMNYSEYLAKAYNDAGKEFNLDPFLLVSVGHIESSQRNTVTSSEGAIGIMQVMPYWAEAIPFLSGRHELSIAYQNIRAGAYILRHYIGLCGGLEQGLRCYNGGPGGKELPNVIRYSKKVLTYYSKMESI